MKNIVISLFLALLVGFGVALELPEDSTVTITDDAGIVVGFGSYAEGSLELTLSEDAVGFLTLDFTAEDGSSVSVEVMVSEDGSLVVVDTFEGLVETIETDGGSVEIETVTAEEVAAGVEEDVQGGVEDGLDVADAAAGEHGAEGRAIARDVRDGQGPPDFAGGEGEVEEDEEPEVEADPEALEDLDGQVPAVAQQPL